MKLKIQISSSSFSSKKQLQQILSLSEFFFHSLGLVWSDTGLQRVTVGLTNPNQSRRYFPRILIQSAQTFLGCRNRNLTNFSKEIISDEKLQSKICKTKLKQGVAIYKSEPGGLLHYSTESDWAENFCHLINDIDCRLDR